MLMGSLSNTEKSVTATATLVKLECLVAKCSKDVHIGDQYTVYPLSLKRVKLYNTVLHKTIEQVVIWADGTDSGDEGYLPIELLDFFGKDKYIKNLDIIN